MRIVLALATVLFAIPAVAGDFSYAQWREMPEAWQRGYAAAVVGHLSIVENTKDPNGHLITQAFSECLTGVTDENAASIIRSYAVQHPDTLRLTVTGIALRAFAEKCSTVLPPH